MSILIKNTLTGKKEEFVPHEHGKVKMYVCGVTVYDDIHMGHARSIIVFDVIVRYLRHCGYDVTYLTNFTDVDDKIINRAAEENVDALEISSRYIQHYFEDVAKLGIRKADLYPKASEEMPSIIEMVEAIIENDFGYSTEDGSVYFSVDKVKDYGRLTKQKLENMESSGRIVLNDQKKNPMDFAIWKAAKPGEISWDSPWGKGRPGWHIECSAMIRKYLGDEIDIHGGGNDLIFPHHENEILQTEAITGKPLSKYWMHNGMLQVQGEKMSKSLGNFFRVRDIAQKYNQHIIRFYFLNTHYMSPLMYSEDMLIEARTSLERLTNNYTDLKAYIKQGPTGDGDVCDVTDKHRSKFMDAMNDDFNTRAAIEEMFQLARITNKSMADGTMSKEGAGKFVNLLNEFNEILGIFPEDSNEDDCTFDSVMQILIDLRAELRKRKAYDLSDMIRDRLGEADVHLEDSGDGVKWKKI
ncbi:MAG TPA: cysteine--tRNA ligase [Candidatus Methanomethylophilaceae archaeon]|nr:cysteine--tRNA ligase [Candidatus Methanomethylophilaceae archaeon]